MNSSLISQNRTHLSQIPQLSQVQYDTASQLFYVHQALLALGYPGLKTVPTQCYSPDNQVEQVIAKLEKKNLSAGLDEKQLTYFAYAVANRLGMYDAADVLRFW